MTDYARSLDRLRRRIGAGNDLDLTRDDHRLTLLKFLNDWGCRPLAVDWHWLAAAKLECWYCGARERLNGLRGALSPLDDASRRDLADVFDQLSRPIAARKMSKGREVLVSYGPTAAAKTLFILRPDIFPAWDGPIRDKLGYEGDGASYAQFTADVHAKIAETLEACRTTTCDFEHLPQLLMRPSYTTLAQLVVEYYWVTLTRGVALRRREEIATWLSWCAPRLVGSPSDSAAEARAEASEPQPAAVHAPRGIRIGLVGCVKMKLDQAARAEDLYVSPLFRGRRAYVQRTCERWYVLSALHGLLRPDETIEPYDVALRDVSQKQRRLWASDVLRQLDAELGSCSGLVFDLHAGANYADFGLVRGLLERGAVVERPTAGLSMGRQLSFYAAAGAAAVPLQPAAAAVLSEPGGAPAGSPSRISKCSDDDLLTALADLEEAPALIPAREWPAAVTCLGEPGLYSWVVDGSGAADLSRGLGCALTPGRIYAGQAGATKWPSGRSGDNTLGKRIGGMHLGGRVRGSTLRWTLASVLFDELDVQVQASMVITTASEEALSEWMLSHLSVAVHAHADRDTLEDLEQRVLSWLDPPLNLSHMTPTQARRRLTELRLGIPRKPNTCSAASRTAVPREAEHSERSDAFALRMLT
jgi:hypothetical protein